MTTIWPIVKTIRKDYLKNYQCDYFRVYAENPSNILDNIAALEDKLKSTPNISIYPNMSKSVLDEAVKVYIYFYFCPPDLDSDLEFIKEILLNDSPKNIILTLTRFYKQNTWSPSYQNAKETVKKVQKYLGLNATTFETMITDEKNKENLTDLTLIGRYKIHIINRIIWTLS